MRIRSAFIKMIVLTTIFFLTMGSAYGAPQKSWTVSFLGTTKVPSQLEIVDARDVLADMFEFNQKVGSKYKPGTGQKNPAEEMKAFFEKYKIGIYELALKENASYNIAFLFVAQIPNEQNMMSREIFNKLKKADKSQQAEIHKLIKDSMGEFYVKAPEFKDYFQLEILDFYPFEHIVNNNVEIVSAGGSIALKTFRLIQPSGIKLYLIKKDAANFYVMAVLNSGPDRKIWDDMTKEMISHMQFSKE